jgi:uncharacterized protein (TIRG00374 family)
VVNIATNKSDSAGNRLTRFAFQTGRILLGIFLIWYLARSGMLDLNEVSIIFENPSALVLAVIFLTVAILLNSLRWRMLLNGMGQRLDAMPAFAMLMVAGLVGTFLPGSVAAEAVRVGLARLYGIDWSRCSASILADRLIGLTVTVVVFVGLVVLLQGRQISTGFGGAVIHFLIAAALVVMGGYALNLIYRWLIRQQAKSALSTSSTISFLLLFVGNFMDILRKPRLSAFLVMVSIAIFLCNLSALLVLLMAITGLVPSFGAAAAAFSGAMLANVIPLTPGGIGVGEAAFGEIYQALSGVGAGATVALVMWRIARLISVLPGLIFILSAKLRVR